MRATRQVYGKGGKRKNVDSRVEPETMTVLDPETLTALGHH